jgi:hypothetical protein
MKPTLGRIMNNIKKDCWVFESWSEHPQDNVYYVVKLTCGVQARGRYEATADTFEEAVRKVYNEIIDKWGRL